MPRPVRLLLRLLGGLCALLGSTLLVLHYVPALHDSGTLCVLAASFIPYGALAWLGAAALVAAATTGRPRLLLVGATVTALGFQAAPLIHYLPHSAPTASNRVVRVLSINLNFGKVDASSLAGVIERERPDVIVLLEVQQPILDALDASGHLADFRYRLGNVPPGYASAGFESDEGTFVLSRTPMTELEKLPTPNGQYVVSVQRPNGDVTLIAARPRNALLGMRGWLGDHELLAAAASRHLQQPLIVVGDFNATLEHSTMRRLTALGLTDAADASGRGWLPTYPAGRAIPPMIAIDHLLTNAALTSTDARAFDLPGSDHLGLVVDVAYR